jgi:hypothetical protein
MANSKFDKIFENAEPASPPAPEKTSRGRAAAKTSAAERAAPAQREPRAIGRPPGKRSDPDWKQFSVLLRKQTQRAATNILRDQDEGQDFSALVQQLLEGWVKKQKP